MVARYDQTISYLHVNVGIREDHNGTNLPCYIEEATTNIPTILPKFSEHPVIEYENSRRARRSPRATITFEHVELFDELVLLVGTYDTAPHLRVVSAVTRNHGRATEYDLKLLRASLPLVKALAKQRKRNEK